MKRFAETLEGREYLEKLNKMKVGIEGPGDMSGLEWEAFKLFKASSQRAGTFITERERVLAQIVEGEEIVKDLTRKGDVATGEAKAAAEILLAAEDARRKIEEEGKALRPTDGGENGDPDNEDRMRTPTPVGSPMPVTRGEEVRA